MTNYNVMGYGGVQVGGTGLPTAVFPYSFNSVIYSPVNDKITNANKKIFYKFRGYRIIAELELYSVTDNMYVQVQNLIAQINYSMSNNFPLRLNIHWVLGNSLFLQIPGMLLDSDFSLKDLARLDGMQKVKLKFMSQELVTEIPVWTNAPPNRFIDQDDQVIVDAPGGNIIVFK